MGKFIGKQRQLFLILRYLLEAVSSGKYGKGDAIDLDAFGEDAEKKFGEMKFD